MSRQKVDAGLAIADLGGPEILDLLGVLGRAHHAPTIDPERTVGQRDRRQFYAHTVKLGDKRHYVELRHFHSHSPISRIPDFTIGRGLWKAMQVQRFPPQSTGRRGRQHRDCFGPKASAPAPSSHR